MSNQLVYHVEEKQNLFYSISSSSFGRWNIPKLQISDYTFYGIFDSLAH